MTGIPAVASKRRRRPVFDDIVLGSIERMTERLMRGDEIHEDDLEDMRQIRQRLRAFDNALTAREREAGLIEDDL